MKKWLIIATVLVACGITVFAGVMSINHWNFTILNTDDLISNEYYITDSFYDISINYGTADIKFVMSKDDKCRVAVKEYSKEKHNVHVENDTLTIEYKDTRKWYEHIGIRFGSPEIIVYLSKTSCYNLLINGSTGDVTIDSLYMLISNIDISTSTGDININMASCENMNIKSSTGDINITDTNCINKLKITASTSDIHFGYPFRAGTIDIKVSTGDVTGFISSPHKFIVTTSTGDIEVPKDSSNKICKITTSTGDVKIKYKVIICS